jgi:hypothetical protein
LGIQEDGLVVIFSGPDVGIIGGRIVWEIGIGERPETFS